MTETMTKKWNRAPFGPERVEEMERYLNKMSHEGWQCCEIVRDELRFVRGEQDEYIYRVQYFYESRDGEKDDYLRTLGETGAALVGEYGEVLILRKKTADGAFELYSDLDSKIAALEKRRSYYRSGMLGALVLVLLSGRHAYKAISQYGFSSWLDTQLDSPVYIGADRPDRGGTVGGRYCRYDFRAARGEKDRRAEAQAHDRGISPACKSL